MLDLSGRPIGMSTGSAILELEDLVAALRAFAPGKNPPRTIGCSIDPTQEGLQRMREYIAGVSGQVTPADAERYAWACVRRWDCRKSPFMEYPIDPISLRSWWRPTIA